MNKSGPWIGVDLDGTLAVYFVGGYGGLIGSPVPAMLSRVQQWVAANRRVKICTARAGNPVEVKGIQEWLKYYGLPELEITDKKDYEMVELWDDRAVGVTPNTGIPVSDTRNAVYLKEIEDLKKENAGLKKKLKELLVQLDEQEVALNDL